jgi:hypothetical protein
MIRFANLCFTLKRLAYLNRFRLSPLFNQVVRWSPAALTSVQKTISQGSLWPFLIADKLNPGQLSGFDRLSSVFARLVLLTVDGTKSCPLYRHHARQPRTR